MKKLLPLGIAVYGIIVILTATIGFHLLVLAGVVPFAIVWGGHIQDRSRLYTMEGISIALNGLMLLVLLVYSGILRLRIHRKLITGAIWCMCLLFLLNTAGNLAAKNDLETRIFTPVTFILAILCFRIAAFDPVHPRTVIVK